LRLVAAGWRPLWVVDFPCSSGMRMPSAGRPMHHPFTSPANLTMRPWQPAPARATAKAYDMVLNGSEIGGGSVRIHSQELQSVVFDLLGIFGEEARVKFRILVGCAQVRCATARRHRLRARSAGDVDGRCGQHSRCQSPSRRRKTAADLLMDAPTESARRSFGSCTFRLRVPRKID